MKKFNLIFLLSCKTSWDFDKKNKCDNIIRNWHMTFQTSDFKDKQFLNLLDNKLYPIESLYTKGGLWLKHFSHLNSLCTRATWAITNHTFIGEYCLRFFPRESFSCLCRTYPIKTRYYILYEYKRFNKYWNSLRDTLSQLVVFLEFNPDIFSFHATSPVEIWTDHKNLKYFIVAKKLNCYQA